MCHINISIGSSDKDELDKQVNYLLGLGCDLQEGSYYENTGDPDIYYSQIAMVDMKKFNDFEYHNEEGKRILFNNFDGNYYEKTTFYENGQIEIHSLFDNNAPVGKCVSYYENGQIQSELNYSYQTEGRSRFSNSVLVGGYDGLAAEYFENGQKKYENHYYYDGVTTQKVGTWIDWYSNGQKSVETTYKDGEWDGLWTVWYDNGQKWSEKTYKDGKLDGKRTKWYENGQKWYEVTYKDGELIKETNWDKDGNEL